MPSYRTKQLSVLTMNTVGFTACFAIWVMFSVIGIPIKTGLNLSDTQFGLLAATPILTGSILRLPLGMMTDKFGGRPVYFWLMASVIIPLFLISKATEYWQFLVLGLFVGVAGASFAVGIAYTSRWFSKETAGFAMGIFGAGNAGAALTKFIAPSIVVAMGWEMVPVIYAIAMTVVVALFWMFTYSDESHIVDESVTMMDQLAMLKDPVIWKYCQYYSLVFGGFVALSLWMTKYYMTEYGHGIQEAALMAAIFVLPSGIIRALGGWLSDKYGAHTITYWVMWVSAICLFIMAYPETDLTIATRDGSSIVMNLGVNEYVFTALLFTVGIAWGFGKASVFKYLSDEYPEKIGVMSGIVGLAGGMGGFTLPILFGVMLDYTGVGTTAFMLLFGVTITSIMWMQWSGESMMDAKMRKPTTPDTME